HTIDLGEMGLQFAQPLALFLRTIDRRHVGAGATIAAEFSICAQQRFSARSHVQRRAITALGAIYEVTESLTCIESCPNKSPFLRLRFQVESVIPERRADPIGAA